MGYYLPWALASGVITTIGNVLVSTFTVSTSTAVWIGYQIVLGAGRGCGMQMVTHSTARVVAQSLTLPGNYCSTKRRTTFPIPDCSSQSRLFPAHLLLSLLPTLSSRRHSPPKFHFTCRQYRLGLYLILDLVPVPYGLLYHLKNWMVYWERIRRVFAMCFISCQL